MEHFLFDFSLNGKPMPYEEADRVLKREEANNAQKSESIEGTGGIEDINVTLINGLPGKKRSQPADFRHGKDIFDIAAIRFGFHPVR